MVGDFIPDFEFFQGITDEGLVEFPAATAVRTESPSVSTINIKQGMRVASRYPWSVKKVSEKFTVMRTGASLPGEPIR